MIRTAFNILSPGGLKGRLSILIFHRVLPEIDPLFPDEPDAARFDQMMGWVKQWFNVMPLDHAIDALKTGTLPARAAAITFDDGYADNRTVALPILQKYGLPATFFIATGFLDGGRMWNDTIIESIRMTKDEILDLQALDLGVHENRGTADKRQVIDKVIGQIKYLPSSERVTITESIADILGCRPPNDLMMTSDQVKEMHAAGMQIGAHTIAHPILARLDRATAQHEIAGSKTRLEDLIGEAVSLFAYPNGKPGSDYLAEHTGLVQELGFSAAVSTGWGAARADSDLFQLPRFTPWDQSRTNFASRLMRNLFT